MPVRSQAPQTMTATLRQAIADDIAAGGSFAALERATGVLRQSLMKFTRGETGLVLDAADKLAEYFNLELRPRTKRRGK